MVGTNDLDELKQLSVWLLQSFLLLSPTYLIICTVFTVLLLIILVSVPA